MTMPSDRRGQGGTDWKTAQVLVLLSLVRREKVDLGKFYESQSSVYVSLPKMNHKVSFNFTALFSLRGLIGTLYGPAAVELVQVSLSHVRCTPSITAESHMTKPTQNEDVVAEVMQENDNSMHIIPMSRLHEGSRPHLGSLH